IPTETTPLATTKADGNPVPSQPPKPEPPKPEPPPEIINLLGMTLVRIEAGSFDMGSSDTQIDSLMKRFQGTLINRKDFEREKLERGVKVEKPFYMAVDEVTVGQFRKFMTARKDFKTEAEVSREGSVGIETHNINNINLTWKSPGFDQGENR